jgi:hypothetical protein
MWLAQSAVAIADPGSGQYVRIESGRVRCWVTATGAGTDNNGPTVICEASGPGVSEGGQNVGFLQAPMGNYGLHWDDAVADSAGHFHFGDANIGGAHTENDLVLNYGQTYHVQGWTIQPSSDGTRFTNDNSRHGVFVSIENISSI